MHTFYIGRVQDFNRFIASFEVQRPQAAPTLYFLHLLMPHGPWLYTQNGKVRAVTNPRSPGRTDELWWNADPRNPGVAAAPAAGRVHGHAARAPDRPPARRRPLEQGARGRRSRPRHQLPRQRPAPRSDEDEPLGSRVHPALHEAARRTERAGRHTHVTTEDILPTIADVLGVDVPWDTTGVSMLKRHTGPSGSARRQGHGSVRGRARAAQAPPATQLALFGTGAVGAAVRRHGQVPRASRQGDLESPRDRAARQPGDRRQGREQAAAQPAEELAARAVSARWVRCRTCASANGSLSG